MRELKPQETYVIFDNIETTEENYRWYHVLINQSVVREQEFSLIYDETRDVATAIIKFRERLFSEEEDYVEYNAAWFSSQSEEDMRRYLESIFLEPINYTYYETIKEVMVKNDWDYGELLRRHKLDKRKRIWRIISAKRKSVQK